MDGGLDYITDIMTHPKVNGKPIIILAELPVHSIVRRVVDHHNKLFASLNLWWGEELLAPFNSKIHQPVRLVHG